MSRTHQIIVDAMVSVSSIDPASVSPDHHIFNDLGVDSLDFLDVTFEIDRALGVKLPIEDWLAQAKESGAGDLFVMKNFVAKVDDFCATPAV